MSGASATSGTGKRVGYYEHSATRKNESTLNHKLLDHKPRRIPALKIEPVVWEEIKRFVMSDEFSRNLLLRAQAMQGTNEKELRGNELNSKLKILERQIDVLAERIAKLPEGINPKPLFDKLGELQNSQSAVTNELKSLSGNEIESSQLISFESLELFRMGLRELILKGENDPVIRSKITKLIVHKIEIMKDGFEIHFHVGQAHYNKALGDQTPSASFFVSMGQDVLGGSRLGQSQFSGNQRQLLTVKNKKPSDGHPSEGWAFTLKCIEQ